jgi:molybdate transport system substrate-binding protein
MAVKTGRGTALPGYRVLLLLFVLQQTICSACFGDEIRVAAASNFRLAMSSLAANFERDTGHEVLLIFGSTGKHYAQIIHGAPFDAFFAADSERPARLEQNGLAVPATRFTYARGQLVLFRPGDSALPLDEKYLQEGNYRYLAIANPALAPYGKAALQVLESLGLRESLKQRLVMGENVGQAYQFVFSGNAELGFVARSQLDQQAELTGARYWLVPAGLHQPIDQQAVLLKDTPAARDFMLYVRSDKAITVILEHGYLTP